MISATAGEIIDQAMTLKEGGRITIQCHDYEEMENLRVNLYKTRKLLEKSHRAMARMLWISRQVIDNGWLVHVTKEKTVSNIVIVDGDGTVKPFEHVEPAIIDGETDVDRVARLMKEDGKTEEEISDTLAEMGEDSFDKAASRLEEIQAAGEAPESVEVVTGKKNVRKKKKTTSK